ncbi:MAG: hypothetical protein ACT4OX_13445 [Actinomycetota bacterium]
MEVAALWAAPTSADLHRVLVLRPPIRRSSDAHEPFALLAKYHETEPAASAVTAMLLLTDRRWRDAVGHLVRSIARSDVLDEDQLGVLARSFVTADDALYWAVPDDWFSDEGIEIDLGELGDRASPAASDDAVHEGPVLARRELAPPLRRWASEWEARHDPNAWSWLLSRARDLDARSAAAIATGLLDAIECFDECVQQLLVTEATRWPHAAVRRGGIELVAEREGPEAAYAIGKDDPNTRVRAWAASLVSPVTTEKRKQGAGTPRRIPRDLPTEPPTLFD